MWNNMKDNVFDWKSAIDHFCFNTYNIYFWRASIVLFLTFNDTSNTSQRTHAINNFKLDHIRGVQTN
jgi:hypothetical protein